MADIAVQDPRALQVLFAEADGHFVTAQVIGSLLVNGRASSHETVVRLGGNPRRHQGIWFVIVEPKDFVVDAQSDVYRKVQEWEWFRAGDFFTFRAFNGLEQSEVSKIQGLEQAGSAGLFIHTCGM